MPHAVKCTSYVHGNYERWPPFPEAVLPRGEEVMTVKVACQLFSNKLFQSFAENRQ